jgi:predicted ATPase/class 3 adenylate cyclase
MPEFPRGTVTFLFSDIEGSTRLWEQDRAAMLAVVERHLVLLRIAIERHQGVLFKVVGDAVQAAFPTAPQAAAAALDAQRALNSESWEEIGRPLVVRMALHTAAAEPRDGDYLAPGLNRLARLIAAGHGGQVLLSLATQDLARDALPVGTSLRDLGDHGLRDLYRPERVFQLLHPALRRDFPPLRTLASRPNNLPVQPTQFLGREAETRRIVELLRRDDVRLLTITGPGGVGKTRLALQSGADILESFRDGVWLVDLSPLDDPALVLPAIASVLEVRDESGDLASQLVAALQSKDMLLILDNFERLLLANQQISELLSRLPGLKSLVTSRISLHAYGEWEFALSPLSLPDPARLPSLDQINQFDAVRLFIERAQAVRPDFAITNANAPAVAEICSRLDGLPLAIELAAALVKVLPPPALLKRLERRLPLLTGGARTQPLRQQTMRHAIAWSHDLLTEQEQLLFQRLTVFPGGCTFEAAQAVNEPDELDVFVGISSLVDKSLLRQEEGSDGEPRFRMLETVREFAGEQLDASDDAESIRQRQAAWCVALAELIEPPEFFTPDTSPEWVARLNEELPNLRAAIDWLLGRGCGEQALRLLVALHDYWMQRHFTDAELHRWLEAALAAAPDAPARDAVLAHWLLAAGNSILGNAHISIPHAEQMLAAAEKLGDRSVRALALMALGDARDIGGDLTLAAAAFAAAMSLKQDPGPWQGNAWFCQTCYGEYVAEQGSLAAGAALMDEGIAWYRELGPKWAISSLLHRRGHVALVMDDLPLAASLFTEAIVSGREYHVTRAVISGVAGAAGIALARGEAERATHLLGALDATREALVLKGSSGLRWRERIRAATRMALSEEAFASALASGRALSFDEAIAEALAISAEVAATVRR